MALYFGRQWTMKAIADDHRKTGGYLFERNVLSPKDAKRIGAMWGKYGKTDGAICRDCEHFRKANGAYSKCALFGVSMSAATDWNGKFIACGQFRGSGYVS